MNIDFDKQHMDLIATVTSRLELVINYFNCTLEPFNSNTQHINTNNHSYLPTNPCISPTKAIAEITKQPPISPPKLNNDLSDVLFKKESIQHEHLELPLDSSTPLCNTRKRKMAGILKKEIRTKRKCIPEKAKKEMLIWLSKADHPYPSLEFHENIADKHSLSIIQVKKWFANYRVRNGVTRKLIRNIKLS